MSDQPDDQRPRDAADLARDPHPEPLDGEWRDDDLDPDVRAAAADLDEPDDPQALSTDGLLPETGDDVWSPPQAPPSTLGETAQERRTGESLDERLAQEQPDTDPLAAGDLARARDEDQV